MYRKTQNEGGRNYGEEKTTALVLFGFLYLISQWIQTVPFAHCHGDEETGAFYVWFDDVIFSEDDFWQE